MSNPDFIIVGAGSAGCVLANRLSANGKHSVTLLEAGGTDKRFWIQLPIGYGKTFFDPKVNWKYTTNAVAGLNGRTSYWPRGKALGGSSSINAMVYIRGQARDFDDWAAQGNPGWSAAELMPYFEQFEDAAGYPNASAGSKDLHITDTLPDLHPLINTWFKAGEQAGYPTTKDFNRGTFEGIGYYRITTKHGRRHSTAQAFLEPARKRANLEVITHAHATRILFNGKQAEGVEYDHNGQLKHLKANREVIVCGGTINSPQLLQLSGVGDAALLNSLGIDVVIDKPSVGANLQDHIGINYYYKSRVPTLNDALTPISGKLKVSLQYLLKRRGILSLSVNQGGGFVRSNAAATHPNLQLYFNPISYTQAPAGKRPLMRPDPYSAYILSFQPCRPISRGYLKINSADPFKAPEIQPNYLSNNEDIADVLEGCHLMRALANTAALKEITSEELFPGPQVQSDEALLDDFKNRADTVFHPIGTCAMGNDISSCVVDHRLRVHGISGLRVIDASVFPNLTSGNTNAPTIMVAEKGAELILQDTV